MASWPPKKNAAFVFYVGLISQADTKLLQANPTLAAGDAKVATDDAAPGNLATLPVVDADFTDRVKVSLSAGEMNGDRITVIFSDAAGAEWTDLLIDIPTSVRQIDDLATAPSLATLTNALVLTSATIETVTSQTQFVIPATADPVDDDAINGTLAVFIDGADPNQKSVRLVTDYDAITRTITVGEAPDFTITTSDTITILSTTTARLLGQLVLTGADQNVTDSLGRRLRDLQEFGTYEGGAVWIDTVNGTAGTTDFESGTYINPVDNIADANTIAASVGLVRFQVAPGSSITFPAVQTNEVWEGQDWTLALGGRDITGSFISGAMVTGIGVATDVYELEECDIGAVTLDNDGHFERCGLTGTFTIGQVGTFTLHQCFTESTTAITIDFAAVGATAVHLLDFHGQINFKNMATGDTAHITGAGTITTETCTAGTIDHDGFFEYTDAGGNVTEQQSDIKVAVDGILFKKNTARNDIPFVMVLSTDHVSPAIGLSPVATKSLDGGTTFTATTGTVTEIANGAYSFDASAEDMNGDMIIFKFSVATADHTFIGIRTGG